jgi:hypothetical protein
VTFLDLKTDLVERHLVRERLTRKSGPTAERLLHDLAHSGGRTE